MFSDCSETKYPVYQKDSLLNTNPNFDFGEFAELPEKLVGLSGMNFVYTFN